MLIDERRPWYWSDILSFGLQTHRADGRHLCSNATGVDVVSLFAPNSGCVLGEDVDGGVATRALRRTCDRRRCSRVIVIHGDDVVVCTTLYWGTELREGILTAGMRK